MSIFFTMSSCSIFTIFFFFNDTATTEIYTLSLHDALPIWARAGPRAPIPCEGARRPPDSQALREVLCGERQVAGRAEEERSEEHTSELQSPCNLVCRLLLEKKKKHRESSLHVTTSGPAQHS